MSDGRLRIETEEDRERLFSARRRGEICGACARPLGPEETVYLERFRTGSSALAGPVGRECASRAMLERTAGTEPERCAGCGRGVYYRPGLRERIQARCSRRCAERAVYARRRAERGEGAR